MNDVTGTFSIRISGYGVERPDDLLANPLNWRVHPDEQRDLLTAVMRNYGIVQNIIVNKRTGHVVDGHLRVKIAMQQGVQALPVTYIDVTPEVEKSILAAFDSVGAMAVCDDVMFRVLVDDIRTFDPPLADALDNLDMNTLSADGGSSHGHDPDEPGDVDKYDVVVSFRSASAQSKFVRELNRRGIKCRTVRP